MRTKDLWENPAECCGCGACAACCPKGAVSLREGFGGFVYPEIDPTLCIDCGRCKKACGLQNHYAGKTSGPWYAASYNGDSSQSASAGVFYALARSVVESGGVVFGAAYVGGGDAPCVRHVMAESHDGIEAIRGSKYVQSEASACFPEVRHQLATGREVLFSGTPCQVAGLHGYLGREWPNLITVDLVCHGVPSELMFRSLVASIERGHGGRVVDFRFRCKRDGWGHSLLLVILRPFGAVDSSRDEKVFLPARDFAYYDLFLNFKTLRDSCYSCPFASSIRPGDITAGDFWGIEKNRPDVLEDVRFDLNHGVSCLLVNNEHGCKALERYGGSLDLIRVLFDDIARGNDQLRHPGELPSDRDIYLKAFAGGGWPAVDALWRKRERGASYRVKQLLKKIIPENLLRLAKKALRDGGDDAR